MVPYSAETPAKPLDRSLRRDVVNRYRVATDAVPVVAHVAQFLTPPVCGYSLASEFPDRERATRTRFTVLKLNFVG